MDSGIKPPLKAQQDLRSWRNAGVFTGDNPDQFGNQNAWGIYGEHTLIATLREADSFLSQEQVNALARKIVLSFNHHDELVKLVDNLATVIEAFNRGEKVPPALSINASDEARMTLDRIEKETCKVVPFGDLHPGERFQWGSIQPNYQKLGTSEAKRCYFEFVGKVYTFSPKVEVIRMGWGW